jgi:general secretion pathway protein M
MKKGSAFTLRRALNHISIRALLSAVWAVVTPPKAQAVVVYLFLIVCPLAIATLAMSEYFSMRWEVFDEESLLTQLEQKGATAGSNAEKSYESGFLEGPTVTIAGAALQKRVGEVIEKVKGVILSANVDLQDSQTKDGYISLSTECEMEQSAIQPFLYDLESGSPFLFVENLAIQPQTEEPFATRVRMQIVVSAKWRPQ